MVNNASRTRRFEPVGKGNRVVNRSRRLTFALFSLPGLLLYSLFFIYPVLLGIYYSTTDWNGIAPKINNVGFANYVNLLTNKRFRNAMLFNIRYTVILVAAIVVIGIFLALLLNSKLKGITFYRAMFFLPAVLCGITISLVFGQIYYRVIPPIGQSLGIEALSTSILGNRQLAMYGILIVHIWQGLAMPTVLFMAGLQTIPEELFEAAMIDGASAWQRFIRITVPFLLPVLSIVTILTVKGGLGVFDYIKGLTDGGPAKSTISLSYLIYEDAFAKNRFSLAIAEAIVVSLILIAISLVQLYITNKKKVYKE